MTNDEINIAIAEYCGWTKIKEIDYQPDGTDPYIDGPDQMWLGIHPESDSDSDEYECFPDYCNDLNAMYEAEELFYAKADTLEGADRMRDYSKWLCYLTKYPLHATASQRAEAFLKTIGK